jgi:hypothetical protein
MPKSAKKKTAKKLTEKELRDRRNLAVFFSLAAFVALVYAITVVKIKLGYVG